MSGETITVPDGRFLVIGCGSIGKRHLSNLKQLGVTDLAGFDVREDRRREVEERFGVPVFAELASALSQAVRVALVCTPTYLHLHHALMAARANCHLFIEKPIAVVTEGLDELLEEVKRRRLVTFVACNFRFHPGLRHVKALLDKGAIGKVISARAQFGQYLPDWHPWEDYRQGYSAQRLMGGGVILDRIHEFDYVRWLLGEVAEVYAMMGHLSHLEIDCEDTAEILLRFYSGAIGSIHLDYIRRESDCSLEILGEEGNIQWNYKDHSVRWYLETEAKWQSLQFPLYNVDDMYVAELRHFLTCLSGVGQIECSAWGGKKVLQIAQAVKQSSLVKRPIAIEVSRDSSLIAAIIQARTNSKRLDKKVLADIAGKPMVQWVIERVKAAVFVNKVILATTVDKSDDELATFAKTLGVEVFRGSENDVLDRYYQAARFYSVDIVVRITADCPLLDPTLIDKVLTVFLEGDCDYASLARPISTFPDGLDSEVFYFEVLERVWKEATFASEREHVTPYIWTHPETFGVRRINYPEDLSAMRWTVDEERDLQFVREVYRHLGDGKERTFRMSKVLKVLERDPKLLQINQGIERDSEYKNLIKKERKGNV